LALLPLLSH